MAQQEGDKYTPVDERGRERERERMEGVWLRTEEPFSRARISNEKKLKRMSLDHHAMQVQEGLCQWDMKLLTKWAC